MSSVRPCLTESVPLSMETALGESTPWVPFICLLSAGADPTKLIEAGPGPHSDPLYHLNLSRHEQMCSST